MTEQPAPVKLLILGTGTFAMDVADLVSDLPTFEVAGFVASLPPYEPGSMMLGKPIYWIDELTHFDHRYRPVCALVTTRRVLVAAGWLMVAHRMPRGPAPAAHQ